MSDHVGKSAAQLIAISLARMGEEDVIPRN